MVNVWGDSIGAGIMHARVGVDVGSLQIDTSSIDEAQPEYYVSDTKLNHNRKKAECNDGYNKEFINMHF